MLAPPGKNICFFKLKPHLYYLSCLKGDIITLYSHNSIILKEIHSFKPWFWNILTINRSLCHILWVYYFDLSQCVILCSIVGNKTQFYHVQSLGSINFHAKKYLRSSRMEIGRFLALWRGLHIVWIDYISREGYRKYLSSPQKPKVKKK